MACWSRWLEIVFVAVVAISRVCCDRELQADLGMRPKRRPSEADHRVTIDLSALRPSLPGLVLYKYGDLAPKLVQVDLSALNPHLQPHVIWPQFSEMEMDDRPFDFEQGDAIPYLTEEESFMSPRQHQRMAKMTSWLDPSNNDIYDFVPESVPKDQLLSLHESLPLADEVIVPLDWEEGKTKGKRNVFLTRGWRPGGDKGSPHTLPKARKGFGTNFNSYYTRASVSGIPRKGTTPRRETESEERTGKTGSSKGTSRTKDMWGPNALPLTSARGRTNEGQQSARIPSQESWSVPRKYWNVPHLFVNNWQ